MIPINTRTYGRGLITPDGLELQRLLKSEYKNSDGDMKKVIGKNLGYIESNAIDMMSYGRSHRNLPVGAIGLAMTKKGLVVLQGANYSPKYGDPKQCAEINVLKHGHLLKVLEILGIWVAAPNSPDLNKNINNLHAPTLHPCVNPCRETFSEDELVKDALHSINFTTLAIGSDFTIEARECFTLPSLSERYKGIPRPLISAEIVAAQTAALPQES